MISAMKRRIFISLLSVSFVFIVFIIRLFWLQTFATHVAANEHVHILRQSVLQRGQQLVIDDGRAGFYDRHMNVLTGKTVPSLAVFPLHEVDRPSEQQLGAVAEILHVKPEQFVRFVSRLQQPSFWPVRLTDIQIKTLEAIDVPGLLVVPAKVRYEPPYIASHLIGYVSQHPERIKQRYEEKLRSGRLAIDSVIGASGLELALDDMLHGVEPTTLTMYTDGQQRMLRGLQTRIQYPRNGNYPLKAVLTIDKPIQQHIEALFEALRVHNGAAVVLDVSNADVVASVSRPQFRPDDIHLADNDWANKALQAAVPGSIFKLVVAAAALEGGYASASDVFHCNGSYAHRSLGSYRLACWQKAGHGSLTFEQAFAASCNVAFAQVMERIPSHELQLVATKMGLAQPIGWATQHDANRHQRLLQFHGEEAGQLFAYGTPQDDVGVRAQTAIGQRDVMMTPLQAANLVVTLLNDGEVKCPRVVSSLRFNHGRIMRSFPKKRLIARHKGISAKTTRTLRHWMEETVTYGTGSMLKQAKWPLAGKSGTAQVSSEGGGKVNQWFIGYGPVQKPQYAIAVLVQVEANDRVTSHRATELFREIMNGLAERNV